MVKSTFSPHIAIQVNEYPKAVSFLRDVLGFHIVSEGKTETEMTKNGVHFYVEDDPARQTFFEFSTGELAAKVKQLEKAGCRLKETQIPEGGKSYLVFTPFGFNFHLWEPEVDSNSPDPVIHQTADLKSSVEEAFNYFTEPDKITQWLTQKAEIEPRVGGKYELFWTPEDPDPENNSTFGCRIQAIDPPNFIHFEWKGNAEQKHFMNCVQPLTQVSVTFTGISENQTRINLLHSGWRQGSEWESARQYFINAWNGALKQLEKNVLNG